jgi:HPt (histidine-containing phosphotransfer) domain-containing protein
MFYTSIGFTGYLPKPVDGVILERTILKHIPAVIRQDPPYPPDETDPQGMAFDLGWLNEIDGISAADGIRNSGGVQTFISALRMFSETIAPNAETIRRLYDDNDLMHLRFKVHSMSRSAKIIGAYELSRSADEIVEAAGSEDMEYIDAHIDSFLSVYCSYKEKLSRLS